MTGSLVSGWCCGIHKDKKCCFLIVRGERGLFSNDKKETGVNGEKLVADYLKKNKYKILKKNYRTAFGEADIVSEKENFLVFTEVKTRASELYGKPCEAVDYKKRARYFRIAEFFISCNEKYKDYFVRFDVAEVLAGDINYIENAFTSDD